MCELVNEAAVSFDLEPPDWSMLSRALNDACEEANIETIDDLSFESAELEIGNYKFAAYTAEVKPDDADTCHLAFSTIDGELHMFLVPEISTTGDEQITQ
jgi:hypothetical protein